MAGGLESHHLKVDVLRTVVFLSTKGDWQCHSADSSRSGTGDDAKEILVGRKQCSHVIAHVLQGPGEDDVETVSSVDEYFSQVDLADHRADHNRV